MECEASWKGSGNGSQRHEWVTVRLRRVVFSGLWSGRTDRPTLVLTFILSGILLILLALFLETGRLRG